MIDPVLITGYLALFVAVGGAFLAVNLLVGMLVRPQMPNTEKLEVYECGEPTIGSSFVQFDLRFYVVALLFIIFDVEVAVFFPWATVFGKASQLSDPALVTVVATAEDVAAAPLSAVEATQSASDAPQPATVLLPDSVAGLRLSEAAEGLFRELGFRDPVVPQVEIPASREPSIATSLADRDSPVARGSLAVREVGGMLARTAVVDMAVFFAVLLVGFAYVWYRGDLDWVRAVSAARAPPRLPAAPAVAKPPETVPA